MSALTDLFTSMANKIRSKVGGSQTYTPLQMVSAIDDVYDAGAASVPAPASITPSNASPVALTANTAVKPTAAGYAIESYSDATPSNSSPAQLTSGGIYKMASAGMAIQSMDSVTPSDASPYPVSSEDICKMTGNGYAIQSYTDITPSADGAEFSAGINKMSGGGYAYSQRPSGGSTKYGTIGSYSINSEFTVQTGLTSVTKFTLVTAIPNVTNRRTVTVYDADVSTTTCAIAYLGGSVTSNATNFNTRNTYMPVIKSISGGDITILTGSNIAIDSGFWFAE